eukprot:TRINITY_DN3514_c0_g1_i1.p1 TRINITY_DN3514_c0_g1~~TRINITY_DN3514_c0_g1_i1.p1  ORF type:complete len:566 (+),score=166.96 TRINITY_DN3514_c0_g1_i1:335-2032(+)
MAPKRRTKAGARCSPPSGRRATAAGKQKAAAAAAQSRRAEQPRQNEHAPAGVQPAAEAEQLVRSRTSRPPRAGGAAHAAAGVQPAVRGSTGRPQRREPACSPPPPKRCRKGEPPRAVSGEMAADPTPSPKKRRAAAAVTASTAAAATAATAAAATASTAAAVTAASGSAAAASALSAVACVGAAPEPTRVPVPALIGSHTQEDEAAARAVCIAAMRKAAAAPVVADSGSTSDEIIVVPPLGPAARSTRAELHPPGGEPPTALAGWQAGAGTPECTAVPDGSPPTPAILPTAHSTAVRDLGDRVARAERRAAELQEELRRVEAEAGAAEHLRVRLCRVEDCAQELQDRVCDLASREQRVGAADRLAAIEQELVRTRAALQQQQSLETVVRGAATAVRQPLLEIVSALKQQAAAQEMASALKQQTTAQEQAARPAQDVGRWRQAAPTEQQRCAEQHRTPVRNAAGPRGDDQPGSANSMAPCHLRFQSADRSSTPAPVRYGGSPVPPPPMPKQYRPEYHRQLSPEPVRSHVQAAPQRCPQAYAPRTPSPARPHAYHAGPHTNHFPYCM